jgi:hypothetical protein
MRPELLDPVRDQAKLQKLLPLAEEVFRLHEAGQGYAKELKAISCLATRIVGAYDIDVAFGCESPEDFARRLLIDWFALPNDLSEPEMLELLEAICTARGNQVCISYWVKCLEVNTGDNRLSDLIFWPGEYFGDGFDGRELSPSEILEIALRKKTKNSDV